MADEIVFLGTGGGRVVMSTQARATGGFRINAGRFKIHVDPGTGSIVKCREFHQNPQSIDALVVTHAHPDHCADVNVYAEAVMISRTNKKRTFLGSESVINGTEKISSALSKYHKKAFDNIKVMKPGSDFTLKKDNSEIKIKGLKARHGDETTFGARFEIKDLNKVISYTSDTTYFKELAEEHKNSDILILDVTRPRNARLKKHLCSEDAAKLLAEAEPELALLTHMGMKVLRTGPKKEAAYIQRESGVRTIPATDGLKVSLHEDEQSTLKEFKQ